jgi:hypothetical protein
MGLNCLLLTGDATLLEVFRKIEEYRSITENPSPVHAQPTAPGLLL